MEKHSLRNFLKFSINNKLSNKTVWQRRLHSDEWEHKYAQGWSSILVVGCLMVKLWNKYSFEYSVLGFHKSAELSSFGTKFPGSWYHNVTSTELRYLVRIQHLQQWICRRSCIYQVHVLADGILAIHMFKNLILIIFIWISCVPSNLMNRHRWPNCGWILNWVKHMEEFHWINKKEKQNIEEGICICAHSSRMLGR